MRSAVRCCTAYCWATISSAHTAAAVSVCSARQHQVQPGTWLVQLQVRLAECLVQRLDCIWASPACQLGGCWPMHPRLGKASRGQVQGPKLGAAVTQSAPSARKLPRNADCWECVFVQHVCGGPAWEALTAPQLPLGALGVPGPAEKEVVDLDCPTGPCRSATTCRPGRVMRRECRNSSTSFAKCFVQHHRQPLPTRHHLQTRPPDKDLGCIRRSTFSVKCQLQACTLNPRPNRGGVLAGNGSTLAKWGGQQSHAGGLMAGQEAWEAQKAPSDWASNAPAALGQHGTSAVRTWPLQTNWDYGRWTAGLLSANAQGAHDPHIVSQAGMLT